jgi:cytochrome b involved in lipid metabolism
MPPPPVPRKPPTTLAVPSTTTSLRVPYSGPLPNRGLVPPPSSSLAVQLTSAVKTPNPRKKVVLAPGHSPLDWAHLIKSNKNLSGVDRLIRVTPSMLKHHNGRRGKPAWASYQGKVYNTSPYLPYHPGGEGELKRAAGKDGEKLFMEVHPWVNWDNMLGDCLVGIMVSESDGVRHGEERNMDDVE